jgi:hypothetical protein
MAGTVRVAVVGVCATGKSLLVKALVDSGYDAHECAQEHSYVPTMWKRLCHPDILIYLDADVSALRSRTFSEWSARDLRVQRHRLRHARVHCDLHLHTDAISVEEVRERVLGFIERRAQTYEMDGSSQRKEQE